MVSVVPGGVTGVLAQLATALWRAVGAADGGCAHAAVSAGRADQYPAEQY